jgi:post-segregation antitoxin (ccd killing protein)
MAKYDTVSAKIPPDMSRKIKAYKINVSDTIRKALGEEIRRMKAAEIEAGLEGMAEALNKISIDEVVHMIREDRDQR